MKHPNTHIYLKTSNKVTVLHEYVKTWEGYQDTLRRFRELMDESPASLKVEVK